MKKLFIFIFLFTFTNLQSSEIKFEKIFDDLNKPWSLSFINKENVIITEKTGKLLTLNLKDNILVIESQIESIILGIVFEDTT